MGKVTRDGIYIWLKEYVWLAGLAGLIIALTPYGEALARSQSMEAIQ
jgi:hypothetical protein